MIKNSSGSAVLSLRE